MDTFLTKSSKKTTPLNSKDSKPEPVTNSKLPTPPNCIQYRLPHNLAGKSATSAAKSLAKNKTPRPKSKARARTFSKTDISPKNSDPKVAKTMGVTWMPLWHNLIKWIIIPYNLYQIRSLPSKE